MARQLMDMIAQTTCAGSSRRSAYRPVMHQTDDRYIPAELELERWRGSEIKTIGGGFLATFDGPELVAGDVAGIAVHIGARAMSCAAAGEVLASSTVKDLVVGSGLRYTDRGLHALKGVPDEWHLYALER